MRIRSISIQFPVEVDVSSEEAHILHRLVSSICDRWEQDNPTQVLWPCGTGFSPKWEMGDIVGFDESAYSIDCSTRDAYESDINRRKPFTPFVGHSGPCARDAEDAARIKRLEDALGNLISEHSLVAFEFMSQDKRLQYISDDCKRAKAALSGEPKEDS